MNPGTSVPFAVLVCDTTETAWSSQMKTLSAPTVVATALSNTTISPVKRGCAGMRHWRMGDVNEKARNLFDQQVKKLLKKLKHYNMRKYIFLHDAAKEAAANVLCELSREELLLFCLFDDVWDMRLFASAEGGPHDLYDDVLEAVGEFLANAVVYAWEAGEWVRRSDDE